MSISSVYSQNDLCSWQFHGFTCGLDDLIILPNYDIQRKEKLEGEDVGEEVHCDFVKFKPGQIGMVLENFLEYDLLLQVKIL